MIKKTNKIINFVAPCSIGTALSSSAIFNQVENYVLKKDEPRRTVGII